MNNIGYASLASMLNVVTLISYVNKTLASLLASDAVVSCVKLIPIQTRYG